LAYTIPGASDAPLAIMLSSTLRQTPNVSASRACRCDRYKVSPSARAMLFKQQRRDLWFGPWFPHIDSELLRAHRRRHRMLRYRYMDSVDRRRPWDNSGQFDDHSTHSSHYSHKSARKSAGGGKKDAQGSPSIGLWDKVEALERDIADYLFPSRKTPSQRPGASEPSLQNIRTYLNNQRAPEETAISGSTHSDGSRIAIDPESTFIDPITNRRVSKVSPPHIVPQTSASTSFTPKFEDLDREVPLAKDRVTEDKSAKRDSDRDDPSCWNDRVSHLDPGWQKADEVSNNLESYEQQSSSESAGAQTVASA
jgi:hypothetical protein